MSLLDRHEIVFSLATRSLGATGVLGLVWPYLSGTHVRDQVIFRIERDLQAPFGNDLFCWLAPQGGEGCQINLEAWGTCCGLLWLRVRSHHGRKVHCLVCSAPKAHVFSQLLVCIEALCEQNSSGHYSGFALNRLSLIWGLS